MKQLEGVQIGALGPVISHLFFAYDTLIFLRADVQNCRNLVHILERYCDASEQKVNTQKSNVFFGENIPNGVSVELGNILGIPVVDNPGTYWVFLLYGDVRRNVALPM